MCSCGAQGCYTGGSLSLQLSGFLSLGCTPWVPESPLSCMALPSPWRARTTRLPQTVIREPGAPACCRPPSWHTLLPTSPLLSAQERGGGTVPDTCSEKGPAPAHTTQCRAAALQGGCPERCVAAQGSTSASWLRPCQAKSPKWAWRLRVF